MTQLRALAALALAGALTGCSGGSSPGASPQASTTVASTTSAPAPADTTASPSAGPATPTETSAPAAAGLIAYRTVHHTERVGKQRRDITLPVFSGRLAGAINQRVERSTGLATSTGTDPADDQPSSLVVKGEVTVNDGRTVQVSISYSFYADGAAHPTDSVSTVVLRSSDGRPVLLTEVLREPTPALRAALRFGTDYAKQTGQDDPAQTLTTSVKDWVNWQTTSTGMVFLFDDYQAGSHAGGLRRLEVPWSVLRPWVSAEGYALVGP